MTTAKLFPATQTLANYARLVFAVLTQRFEMWVRGTNKHTPTNAQIAGLVGIFVYQKTIAPDDHPAVTIVLTESHDVQEVTVEGNSFVAVNGQVIHVNVVDFVSVFLDHKQPPADLYIPFCTARVENSTSAGLVLINNQSGEHELLTNTPATANF